MAASMAETIGRETRGGDELVEVALRIVRDEGQSMVDRWRALTWLADRGAGKAPTVVETEVTHQLSDGTDLSALSPAQLAARAAELEAQLVVAQLPAGEEPAEVVE